nr:unnamed protein product [Spirometra erinaceieuropaei]
MDLLSATCDNFGLAINTEKTEVMNQPPSDTAYIALQINVNGAQPQVGDNFTYLGSTLSRITKIDDEVARRTSQASYAFGRLQSTVWDRHRKEDVQGGHPADAANMGRIPYGVEEAGHSITLTSAVFNG